MWTTVTQQCCLHKQ